MVELFVVVLLVVAIATPLGGLTYYFWNRHRVARAELDDARARLQALAELAQRYDGLRGVDAAIRQLAAQREQLEAQIHQTRQQYQSEYHRLSADIERLRHELNQLSEEEYLVELGLYEPKYDLEMSERYKEALAEVRSQQKQIAKDGSAAVCHTEWRVDGNAAKGRKMVRDTIKLLLRAFNGECDAAIARVRHNNIRSVEQRIIKSHAAINKMGVINHIEITEAYLHLKLQELYLQHEYQERKQEEKEEQRRIKEQMREEKRAQQELERAQREAEEEEQRYQDALTRARADVEQATGARHDKLRQQIEELERRLEEARTNKERAISRAQMTRSGHVYVISNIGSFGDDVFKIGMTRRLDPHDRVKELGDASVPFSFDIHAMIYCEDAPALERELHKRFHARRVNLVNERKEFFEVALVEVAGAVEELHGQIELTKLAEASEYRETVALRKRRAKTESVPPKQTAEVVA